MASASPHGFDRHGGLSFPNAAETSTFSLGLGACTCLTCEDARSSEIAGRPIVRVLPALEPTRGPLTAYNGGMGKLLLLFIVVPAVELALLIELGSHLGTLPTLALIAVTGVVGAFLARRQGLAVVARAQEQMRLGQLPAGSMADGVMILVAAALLMTPGILTDALGFLLLVPPFRSFLKDSLHKRIRKAIEENRIDIHVAGTGFPAPVYDVTAEPGLASDPESPKYKVH